jgi:hypothetical protein
MASCLHSYFIEEVGKYQYDVILLVQSYFFTKPRRLIDKPAAGKRKGNDNPFLQCQGKKMFASESEKNKHNKESLHAPSYYTLSIYPYS